MIISFWISGEIRSIAFYSELKGKAEGIRYEVPVQNL